MIERLFNLPSIFWQRLFIIFFGYVGANILIDYLPRPPFIDNTLTLSVLFVVLITAGVFIQKTIKNTLNTFLIAQLMFFWMVLDMFLIRTIHLSYKPHAIVFGFIVLAAMSYFFKYFNFIWKIKIFRFLFIFFLINVLYYFCYHSDFNITTISAVYGWSDFSEKQDAKTIIFLDSLAVLSSSILAISVFNNIKTKEEIDKLISKVVLVFSTAFTILFILFPLTGKVGGSGFQVYLSIYFILALGLKYYVDNNIKISVKYNNFLLVFLIILFGFTVYCCNKSALLALFATTILFIVANYKLSLKFNVFEFLKDKRYKLWFFILGGFVIIFLAAKFNLIDMVYSKITASLNAFQGITSFYIRKANWKYFIQYWTSHLDTFKVLFGFGLGKSREIIFYTSSMMYSPIYRVQTTHNHYMEMFFDYGAMALFYFIPLVTIFIKNILNIFNPFLHKNIKLLGNINIALLIFYVLYHMTDGLRVPSAIIFFATLIFIETAKYSLQQSLKQRKNLG